MMGRARLRISGTTRLAVLVAVLALAAAWIALGLAPLPHWDPGWYLPAHTAMETLAVVVAMLVFSTGAQPVDGRMPAGVAVLSTGALAAGVLDFGHLLSVQGMPGLAGPGTAARGIGFWLAARSAAALSLLGAALVPADRTVPRAAYRTGVAGGLALCAAAYWIVLARPDQMPATFVPGRGMTGFKIGWEYALVAANVLAALLYAVRPDATARRQHRYLAAAAAITALAGVPFTLYRTPDDALNMVGHLYKVIACVCLYRAIFVEAVQAPYARLRRSERSLADSEAGFRSLMECAPDAIVLADAAGRIALINARAEQLFGIARAAAAGRPVGALLPPPRAGDVDCPRAQGGTFPAEISRAVLPGGQQVAIVRDLSERRRLERALLDQLTHDALTGLPNRQRILETLAEAIGVARREQRVLGVLVFDVDDFRRVNGRFGWTGGDDVLRECMARLAPRLASGDTLARQGGNEFVIVQADSGFEPATRLALDLLGCMRAPFTLEGHHLALTASIGIALLPARDCSAHELLQMAQVAMADSREAGPAGFRFHTPAMEQTLRDRIDYEAMLRHAVARGQLALQFQPRVSLHSGALVGAEALVRWRHPVLGIVPPGRFIPLAEETGLIEDIDMWVLHDACARAAAWIADGLPLGRVSVNLSARQFQRVGLAQRVRAALDETGLAPCHLELEITEGTVMRDTEESGAVLRTLRDLGVALSIDDFGTGYSSLGYLKRFPLDVLKIDRSFVQDVETDAGDAAIARAIIALGHSLHLAVVAEGVETAGQLAFLRENGCDEVQGYYFSRPVWPDDLRRLLCSGDMVR